MAECKKLDNLQPGESLPSSDDSSSKYVQVLEDENRSLKQFIQNIVSSSPLPLTPQQADKVKDELIAMYELSIADLHRELKSLSAVLAQTVREKEEMQNGHQLKIQDVRRIEQMKLARYRKEQEKLINELICSHLDEIQEWRRQFHNDTKMTVEEACERESKGQTPSQDDQYLAVAQQSQWQKFMDMNVLGQAILFCSAVAVIILFKSFSLYLLRWAWPKLVAFAMYTHQSGILSGDASQWLLNFVQSECFQRFLANLSQTDTGCVDNICILVKETFHTNSEAIKGKVMEHFAAKLLEFKRIAARSRLPTI